MFFMKFQVEAEANLNILNEMFDQAAVSATEEEYPEDYQEHFSYLMEVFE